MCSRGVWLVVTVCLLLAAGGLSWITWTSAAMAQEEPAASGASEPSDAPQDQAKASADDDAMILVDNPRFNADKPLRFDSGYLEDNSSCMVCHIDFQEELIALTHEEQGITCAACHGDSLTHSGDEYNITRPDVIWGRAEIDHFCRQCHEKHEDPAAVEKFRAEWLSKRRPNGRFIMKDSVCTDCHGNHAIVGEEGDFK